jgi:hypothetical protein
VSIRRNQPAIRFGGAVAAAVAAVLTIGPAAYAAAAPANDDYLASTPILTERYADSVDTTEATEQANLFDPAPESRAARSPQAEPLTCSGQAYGRTVWYDFLPPSSGGIRVRAAGFDTVVALYEYDSASGRITRQVACQPGGLDLAAPAIEADKYYTLQVGGATVDGTPRSGPLSLTFNFLADRDGDGVLDQDDPCPDLPGARGGCPPQIAGTPRLAIAGMHVVLLEWAGLPRGTRVTATCRGCGRHGLRQTVRVADGGVAHLRRFDGSNARRGALLDVSATLAPRGSGTYRYGAIGKHARYRIGSTSFHWSMRCLVPGSTSQETTCPR